MGVKKGTINNPNGRPKVGEEMSVEEASAKRKAERLKAQENKKKREQLSKEKVAVRKSARKTAKRRTCAQTKPRKKDLIAAMDNNELRLGKKEADKKREYKKRYQDKKDGKEVMSAEEKNALFDAEVKKREVNVEHRRQTRAVRQASEVELELARRELARRKLLPFIQKFNKTYDAGWVHEHICSRLEKFVEAVERKESPRLMIFMPPRAGKNLVDKTPVFTYNRGLIQHGDLKMNDLVQHPSGVPTRVKAVSPKHECNYEVEITDGTKLQCHGNHEWTVYSRADKRWITVETNWFLQNTNRGTQRRLTSGEMGTRGGRYMYQLPLVEAPALMKEAYQPIAPYLLGVWLGDGGSDSPSICYDPRKREHLDKIEAQGTRNTNSWPHNDNVKYENVAYAYFGEGQIMSHIRSLNLYKNKHIPADYIQGSVEQRLELLAGLIDSDGCVDSKSRVMFSNANKALIDGYFELCQSLNLRPYRMTPVEPTLSSSGIQGKQVIYSVGFQPPPEPYCPAIPTVVKPIKRLVTPRRLAIKSVRVLDSEEVEYGHCIQVEAEDGLYLAGKSLTPTHNSEIASKNFPAWVLGKHPDWEIIASSYAVSLPIGFSRKVQEIIQDKAYKQLFPKTKLHPKASAAESWKTTYDGSYVAAGVGGGITGKGATIFIIDDPVKDAQEADSDTQRQTVWDWWGSTAKTRLAPGGGVLEIQTRWHDADLAGQMILQMKELTEEFEELIANTKHNIELATTKKEKAELESELEGFREELSEIDNWEIIVYPAIAVEDEYIDEEGILIHAPEEERIPELTKVRSTGEALHPSRYPIGRLRNMKRSMQPRHWSALYQQNPVPDEGIYFTKDMIRFTSSLPLITDMYLFAAWDLAVGEKQQNDFSVGVVLGLDYQGQIHVVDMIRIKANIHKVAEAVVAQYKKYPSILEIGIEKGQLELSLMPQLNKLLKKEKLYPTFNHELRPISDKWVRARPLQGRMQMGTVLFPHNQTWTESAIAELLRFPGGIHDDIVDALAWGVRMMGGRKEPPSPTHQNTKSWRDRLNKMGNGARISNTPMGA